MAEFLKEAQRLFNEGKWKDSNKLLDDNVATVADNQEDLAEVYRLYGWNWYYIGIKGPVGDKLASLTMSRISYHIALDYTRDRKKKISIMNGLPLSFWLLGEQKEAWRVSDQAVEEFPEEPSVWNTRSILCRWAKEFEKSVEVCEEVCGTALAKQDFRTAGHGKHNKADALKEMGRTEEARLEYENAIELYKEFEKTSGESAKFHIEGVEKKLAALKG